MKAGYWKLIVAAFFAYGAVGQFQRGDLGMLIVTILLCFGFICWFCYSRHKEKAAQADANAELQQQQAAAVRELEQQERIRNLNEQAAQIRLQLEKETLERFRMDKNSGQAPKLMYIKVAGVTFTNDDGTERQEILEELEGIPGYMVEVELEPYSYRGEPAVRVFADGQQIGNIDRELAPYVTENFERIDQVTDFQIVGGDGLNYGARFTISFK